MYKPTYKHIEFKITRAMCSEKWYYRVVMFLHCLKGKKIIDYLLIDVRHKT